MKNKVLVGLISSATIGSAVIAPTMINHGNTQRHINKVLMVIIACKPMKLLPSMEILI